MEIFENLPDAARVWIYQASRNFSEREVMVLNSQIGAFVQHWTAHSAALRARGGVLWQRFVVLAVDESQADASGCSIDKSVHFLESLQEQYAVDLFDRLSIAYLDDQNLLQIASKNAFLARYTGGGASEATLVFDHTVATLGALREGWLKPVSDSWHWRFLGLHKTKPTV